MGSYRPAGYIRLHLTPSLVSSSWMPISFNWSADGVGRRKITVFARLAPLGDQRLHLRVQGVLLHIVEQPQYPAQLIKEGERRL